MEKAKRLELWWQLYRKSLPEREVRNIRPMDFCSTECTSAGRAPSVGVIPWHLSYNWGKRQGKNLSHGSRKVTAGDGSICRNFRPLQVQVVDPGLPISHIIRHGCTNHRPGLLNSVPWHYDIRVYLGPQHGTCCMSPFWRPEFWGGS